MSSIQNKVIHRFVRPISDYEEGGLYYNKVIPLDTQAYAYYSSTDTSSKEGLFYVLGDGYHTYLEICEGKGSTQSAKEYPVVSESIISNKIDDLIAGDNVVITGTGSSRTISVPVVVSANKFIHPAELDNTVAIGHTVEGLNTELLQAVKPDTQPKLDDIIYTQSNHQLTITKIDNENNTCDGIVVNVPANEVVSKYQDLVGSPYDSEALANELNNKVDKVTVPNTLYGVDENGDQVFYHISDVGIQDVPEDNKTYLRSRNEWVEYQPVDPTDFNQIDDNNISTAKTYSSSKIEDLIHMLIAQIDELRKLKSFEIQIVDVLPEEGIDGVLYLVNSQNTEEGNSFEEYLYIDNNWELIGNSMSQPDLSKYVTHEELYHYVEKADEVLTTKIDTNKTSINALNDEIDQKQDKLKAGYGIQIQDNTISITVLPGEGGGVVDVDSFVMKSDYLAQCQRYDDEIDSLQTQVYTLKGKLDAVDAEQDEAKDLVLSFDLL